MTILNTLCTQFNIFFKINLNNRKCVSVQVLRTSISTFRFLIYDSCIKINIPNEYKYQFHRNKSFTFRFFALTKEMQKNIFSFFLLFIAVYTIY